MEDIRKDLPAPKEEVKQEIQGTAEDMAAHDYQILMPKFWAKIEPMSRRQQQRVFKALMEYPLESDLPKFSYNEEKEAFFLGLQINDCKFVLQKAVMELVANKEKMDAFSEDIKKLTEEKVNEELSKPNLSTTESAIII